jgi:hypothetical protein
LAYDVFGYCPNGGIKGIFLREYVNAVLTPASEANAKLGVRRFRRPLPPTSPDWTNDPGFARPQFLDWRDARQRERDRKFADSLLEGDGFELSVPREIARDIRAGD